MIHSIAVNGKPFARKVKTGTVRVAEHVVAELGHLRPEMEIHVYVPAGPKENLLPFNWPPRTTFHLSRSPIYQTAIGRALWEQFILPLKLRRAGEHAVLLNLTNSAPVFVSPNMPQLLVVHDVGFLQSDWFRTLFSLYLRVVLRRIIRHHAHLVTVSHTSRRQIKRAFPQLSRIEVIHNDSDKPPEYVEPWKEEKPYVLFLGSLNPRKNVSGAIRGFKVFQARRDGAALLLIAGDRNPTIFGDPELGFEDETVRFLGHVTDDERWELLKGARLLLLPSFMEGFGLPVLEAMKVGTPVVASDIPVFRELFDNAVEFVDPADDEAIASGIERVFTAAEYRQELLDRSHRILEQFSWDRAGRGYLAILDQLLTNR